MLTTIHTSAVNGMAAMPVFLEVNANEIHSQEDRTIFFMVGLPDNAVRESKLRVESALQNSTPSTLPPPMCARKVRATTCPWP